MWDSHNALQGSLASAPTFGIRYRRRGRKQGWNFAIHSLDHDEARDPRIADIYAPTKRRTTLEQKRVDEIAASLLGDDQQTPILVRAAARFVLVERQHRLEAGKALREKLWSVFWSPAER